MEPFRTLESKTVVLPNENVDTDQIIPAPYLKGTDKVGLGRGLFASWRYDEAGRPRPEFPLNAPAADGAQILVEGGNFACGSPRGQACRARLDPRFPGAGSSFTADVCQRTALVSVCLPVASCL